MCRPVKRSPTGIDIGEKPSLMTVRQVAERLNVDEAGVFYSPIIERFDGTVPEFETAEKERACASEGC